MQDGMARELKDRHRKAIRRRLALTMPILTAATTIVRPSVSRAVTYSAANTFDITPATLSIAGLYCIAGPQQMGQVNTGGSVHATLWSDFATTTIDLQPTKLSGFSQSFGNATTGVFQVGEALGTHYHAMLWAGTAASAIDLHPTNLAGFTDSFGFSIAGTQEVGYGILAGNNFHALLWSGAANTAVDLTPTNLGTISSSLAEKTDGVHQVGRAVAGVSHAILWSGTANSAVDLHPSNLTGFAQSEAFGVSGNQQVGHVYNDPNASHHAMLWSGAANTAVDLNPTNLPGFSSSFAYETNGSQQVGKGSGAATSLNYHALLWSGTASSAFDLNSLAPFKPTASAANSIDVYGNIAGEVFYGSTSPRAIEWLAGNTYNVATGTGAWNTNTNWTAGIPAAGNDVLLIQSDNATRTVTYANSTAALVLGNLTVDATNSGSMTLAQSINTLNAANEFIGFAGVGKYSQTGGKNNLTGTLTLGAKAGSSGIYTLSGTSTLSAATIQINAGSVNQSGGTVSTNALANNGAVTVATAALGVVTGTGSLTVAVGATAAATSIAQNSLAVSGTLVIAANGSNSGLTVVNSLAVGASGQFDLNDNDLIVNYTGTSPAATIRAALVKGYNGGAWTGAGITSTSAKNIAAANTSAGTALGYGEASDLGITSLDGQLINGNAVVVRYTYCGDSLLDGRVDLGNDFNLFLGGFMAGGSGVWQTGDYNYDGLVNMTDFAMFIDGYAGQGGALGTLDEFIAGTAELTAAQKANLLTVVPEPAMAALLGASAMVIAGARRRRV